MFHKLLKGLHSAYPGDTVYLPDPLYQLVYKWMIAQGFIVGSGKEVKFRGKLVLAYDEESVIRAYQLTPIHLPKRILEKATIMEFSLGESLEEDVPDEPEKEEAKSGKLDLNLKPNLRRVL